MSDTRTPLCDAYAESISAVEIVKHPIREFADAIQFAKKLERKAAHFEAMREALREATDALFAKCCASSFAGSESGIIAQARAALAAADEIGGE